MNCAELQLPRVTCNVLGKCTMKHFEMCTDAFALQEILCCVTAADHGGATENVREGEKRTAFVSIPNTSVSSRTTSEFPGEEKPTGLNQSAVGTGCSGPWDAFV